jgi:hypothetical protein
MENPTGRWRRMKEYGWRLASHEGTPLIAGEQ